MGRDTEDPTCALGGETGRRARGGASSQEGRRGLVSQFSRSVVSDSLRPHGLRHARPPCPS